MSQHWAKTEEAGALIGMRFMIWLDSVVGGWVFNVVLFLPVAYFFIHRAESRRASLKFLSLVKQRYPEALDRGPLLWHSLRQLYSFGISLRDKYRAWIENPADIEMEPDEEKILFDAVAEDRGCLLIGSHFGNLEYCRGIAHRHPSLTINVLVYDQHAKKFAALIERADPDSRMNLIQVTDVDIKLALKLNAKIHDGEWVIIAGDRVPVGHSDRVCEALFFGRSARFPIGPYVLATLLRCPVYLLHCFRLNDRYRLVMERFEEEIRLPRDGRREAYNRYAQKFAAALEAQVACEPLQWFNFYDFWATPVSAVPQSLPSDPQ